MGTGYVGLEVWEEVESSSLKEYLHSCGQLGTECRQNEGVSSKKPQNNSMPLRCVQGLIVAYFWGSSSREGYWCCDYFPWESGISRLACGCQERDAAVSYSGRVWISGT